MPNKVSRELKELAREYTEEAVGALVRVLRDTEAPASAQVAAATAILDRGHGRPTQHIDADHKHLVLCRIERRPPRLDLTVYPYLPKANVAMTSAKAYLGLLAGASPGAPS